jgi:hypothetical protein
MHEQFRAPRRQAPPMKPRQCEGLRHGRDRKTKLSRRRTFPRESGNRHALQHVENRSSRAVPYGERARMENRFEISRPTMWRNDSALLVAAGSRGGENALGPRESTVMPVCDGEDSIELGEM